MLNQIIITKNAVFIYTFVKIVGYNNCMVKSTIWKDLRFIIIIVDMEIKCIFMLKIVFEYSNIVIIIYNS